MQTEESNQPSEHISQSASALWHVSNEKITNKKVDTPTAPIWDVEGLPGKTNVTTSFGDVPAHLLRVHDQVRIVTGAFAEITWIDHIKLDRDFVRRHPQCQPAHIKAGSLYNGPPSSDLVVSPAQRLYVGGNAQVQRAIRADQLIGQPDVSRCDRPTVNYAVFRCDAPVRVLVGGLQVFISD